MKFNIIGSLDKKVDQLFIEKFFVITNKKKQIVISSKLVTRKICTNSNPMVWVSGSQFDPKTLKTDPHRKQKYELPLFKKKNEIIRNVIHNILCWPGYLGGSIWPSRMVDLIISDSRQESLWSSLTRNFKISDGQFDHLRGSKWPLLRGDLEFSDGQCDYYKGWRYLCWWAIRSFLMVDLIISDCRIDNFGGSIS